jgi:hypothetical protein
MKRLNNFFLACLEFASGQALLCIAFAVAIWDTVILGESYQNQIGAELGEEGDQ